MVCSRWDPPRSPNHPDFTTIGGGWNAVKGSFDTRVACGMSDVMADFYASNVGVKFLGQLSYRVGSRIYSNERIDPETASLEGLKLRGAGPTASNFVSALGGTTVSTPIGELYEALDRALVDGAYVGGGAQLAVQFGWHEKLKFVVAQSISYTGGTYLMNLDTWNGLSPDLQDAVLDGIALANYRSAAEFLRLDQEAIRTMVDSGMELITLTDATAQRLDAISFEGQFEVLADNEPPEYVERMRAAANCVKNSTG
jgi:TRAP-type C4-dicarboxylate transport system substrate-binding protein